MQQRARPPEDISPERFFTEWVPRAVAHDPDRRARLGDTEATIEFSLTGDGGGVFRVEIAGGEVRGGTGGAEDAELRVRVDVETWRALNRGDMGAPEAMLRRRLHVQGNFLLGLKLHLILG